MNKSEAYDLKYHITPTRGLLNDPNGLAFFRGRYHVFYQWNPYGTEHANKSWGHVVSDDLVNWNRKDVALAPSEWYDKDGIYSGGSLVHEDKLYLFYTGNVINADGTRASYQCAAVSEDGERFRKLGPLFGHPPGYTRHVRDPKVWREDSGSWRMIVGAQREDLTGDALVYESEDLIRWTCRGSFLEREHAFGYMWECPDVLRFPEQDQDVFVFSPQGLPENGDRYRNPNQSGYLAGRVSENGKFLGSLSDFRELDRGFDFYAPQTFRVGDRLILFGWMSAMTEEKERAVPTVSEGWIHALTIPRDVLWKDGFLYQVPVPELRLLRQQQISRRISGSDEWNLPSLACETVMTFAQPPGSFRLVLRNAVQIDYDHERRHLTVWRTDWLTNGPEDRRTELRHALTELRLFIESSSLEIFANQGEEVFSLRYFTEDPEERGMRFESEASEASLSLYALRASMEEEEEHV